MERVVVVDYGMGNLRSVAKALEFVASSQVEITVTDDTEVIGNADRVVFPGQGAARDCMTEIHQRGLTNAITTALANKPFLGICMGMQVLLDRSEEQDTPCLGVLAGTVKRFPSTAESGLNVPQMGWNEVRFVAPHALWQDIPDGTHFYFMNSYYVSLDDPKTAIGSTEYGIEFSSALGQNNLFAVQFHPEKSQKAGLRLLRNFLEWAP